MTLAGPSLKSAITVNMDLVILPVTSVSDRITDPLAHNWKQTIFYYKYHEQLLVQLTNS